MRIDSYVIGVICCFVILATYLVSVGCNGIKDVSKNGQDVELNKENQTNRNISEYFKEGEILNLKEYNVDVDKKVIDALGKNGSEAYECSEGIEWKSENKCKNRRLTKRSKTNTATYSFDFNNPQQKTVGALIKSVQVSDSTTEKFSWTDENSQIPTEQLTSTAETYTTIINEGNSNEYNAMIPVESDDLSSPLEDSTWTYETTSFVTQSDTDRSTEDIARSNEYTEMITEVSTSTESATTTTPQFEFRKGVSSDITTPLAITEFVDLDGTGKVSKIITQPSPFTTITNTESATEILTEIQSSSTDTENELPNSSSSSTATVTDQGADLSTTNPPRTEQTLQIITMSSNTPRSTVQTDNTEETTEPNIPEKSMVVKILDKDILPTLRAFHPSSKLKIDINQKEEKFQGNCSTYTFEVMVGIVRAGFRSSTKKQMPNLLMKVQEKYNNIKAACLLHERNHFMQPSNFTICIKVAKLNEACTIRKGKSETDCCKWEPANSPAGGSPPLPNDIRGIVPPGSSPPLSNGRPVDVPLGGSPPLSGGKSVEVPRGASPPSSYYKRGDISKGASKN